MDKQFLEFWGNLLINTAKGQQQFEQLTQWMNQDFKGFEELTAMFKKFYGLEKIPKSAPEYLQVWQKSTEHFRESLKGYFSILGVVSLNEHLTLVKKYETLKKENADQAETIEHLRLLLGQKDLTHNVVAENFEGLLNRQNEQFQRLMESFATYMKESSVGGKKPSKA